MARLEQIAAQEYGFAYADELHEKEIGRKCLAYALCELALRDLGSLARPLDSLARLQKDRTSSPFPNALVHYRTLSHAHVYPYPKVHAPIENRSSARPSSPPSSAPPAG